MYLLYVCHIVLLHLSTPQSNHNCIRSDVKFVLNFFLRVFHSYQVSGCIVIKGFCMTLTIYIEGYSYMKGSILIGQKQSKKHKSSRSWAHGLCWHLLAPSLF